MLSKQNFIKATEEYNTFENPVPAYYFRKTYTAKAELEKLEQKQIKTLAERDAWILASDDDLIAVCADGSCRGFDFASGLSHLRSSSFGQPKTL